MPNNKSQNPKPQNHPRDGGRCSGIDGKTGKREGGRGKKVKE